MSCLVEELLHADGESGFIPYSLDCFHTHSFTSSIELSDPCFTTDRSHACLRSWHKHQHDHERRVLSAPRLSRVHSVLMKPEQQFGCLRDCLRAGLMCLFALWPSLRTLALQFSTDER